MMEAGVVRTYGEKDKKAIVEALQHTAKVAADAVERAKKVDPNEKLAPAMLSNICNGVSSAANAASSLSCTAECKQYEDEGEDE